MGRSMEKVPPEATPRRRASGRAGEHPAEGNSQCTDPEAWPPPDTLKELGDQWLEQLRESSELGNEQQ